MDDVAGMSLSELQALLAALYRSTDPYAAGAVRLVKAEIAMRGRARRERHGLTKRHCYGRERARAAKPSSPCW